MKFEYAISLGPTCHGTYQILRTLYQRKLGSSEGFSVRAARKAEIGPGRCFFDWCGTPPRSLIAMLENDFAGVLQPENLRLEQLPGGIQAVYDDNSGSNFMHDFEANRGTVLTLEGVLAMLPEVQQRYARLKEHTIDLMRRPGPKLYVLNANPVPKVLQRLFEVLDTFDANYRLLLVRTKDRDAQDLQALAPRSRERLLDRQVRHEPYPGHAEDWDRVFHDLDLAL